MTTWGFSRDPVVSGDLSMNGPQALPAAVDYLSSSMSSTAEASVFLRDRGPQLLQVTKASLVVNYSEVTCLW